MQETIKKTDEEKIGEGGFSQIIPASHYPGEALAWKVATGKTPEEKQKAIKLLTKEKEIHRRELKHPCIVPVYLDVGDHTKMLMENIHNGFTLRDYMLKQFPDKVLSGTRKTRHEYLTNILLVGGAITSALRYMKTKRIIAHRDIKPENILVEDTDKIFNIRKITLIDLAMAVTEENKIKSMFEQGYTPLYKAPEKYTENNSDVYSLGLTMLDALSGMPEPEEGIEGLLPTYRCCYREFGVYKNLRWMIMEMLETDPARRLDLEELREEIDYSLLIHIQDR